MTLRGEGRDQEADRGNLASRLAHRLFASAPMPALSLAVADRSGVISREALGKADLAFDLAATPYHVFSLGSDKMAVTGTIAARPDTRGLLDLAVAIA